MFSSPFLAMRKLFPFAGFSVVVWPVIVPSSTDQWLGRPAQPVRSLPLNRLLKPGSTSWANRRWVGRRTAALKMSAPANLAMRVMRLQLPTLVSTASEKRLVFSLSSPKGGEGWGEEAHSACCWRAPQELDAPLPVRSSRGEGVGTVVFPSV